MTYLVPSERTITETVGQYKYIGIAASGSLLVDDVWKIIRITFIGQDVVVEYADGDQSSNNKWSERLTKTYS